MATTRPYRYYDACTSLWPTCLRKVESEILLQDGAVWMHKRAGDRRCAPAQASSAMTCRSHEAARQTAIDPNFRDRELLRGQDQTRRLSRRAE